MKGLMVAIESVVGGVVLTYLTGFISSTPSALVGAAWFGLPITWIRKLVIAPIYNPWVIDTYGLIFDILFWIVISFIILYTVNYCLKSGKKQSSGKKR